MEGSCPYIVYIDIIDDEAAQQQRLAIVSVVELGQDVKDQIKLALVFVSPLHKVGVLSGKQVEQEVAVSVGLD